MRRRKISVKTEIKRLSRTDCVIAQNMPMLRWLHENGLRKPLCALALFDYHSPSVPALKNASAKPKVAYAGTLAPRNSSFLRQLVWLISGYELHLYGSPDPGLPYSDELVYHGFVSSDDFISFGGADFGLVWGGDSVDECSGSFGEYLRFNTPHKASFYLRAGIPLIVWEQSAIAPTVIKAGVGITVRSLHELPTRLERLSASETMAMRHNAMTLAAKLNDGFFFKKALREAEAMLYGTQKNGC